MTEQQQRVPSGVPNGGQFAATVKAESDVALAPLDGDFEYPPIMRTGSEIIDFWSRVEIPNVVLARCQSVYAESWQAVTDGFAAQAWKSYEEPTWLASNPAPDPSDVAAQADWEGRRTAASNSYETALNATLTARPELLPRGEIRPLVRAAGMLTAVKDLPDEDYFAVWDHPIELQPRVFKPVGQALIDSGLMAVASKFIDPALYDQDGDGLIDPPTPSGIATKEDLAQMISQVRGMEERLTGQIHEFGVQTDGALGELTDNVSAVGDAILDVNDPRRGRKRK